MCFYFFQVPQANPSYPGSGENILTRHLPSSGPKPLPASCPGRSTSDPILSNETAAQVVSSPHPTPFSLSPCSSWGMENILKPKEQCSIQRPHRLGRMGKTRGPGRGYRKRREAVPGCFRGVLRSFFERSWCFFMKKSEGIHHVMDSFKFALNDRSYLLLEPMPVRSVMVVEVQAFLSKIQHGYRWGVSHYQQQSVLYWQYLYYLGVKGH